MALSKEEQLEAINLHEKILNSLPSGLIFCDNDCRIRFINKTYADYLGVNQTEVIGRLITDIIPGSRISEVLQSGRPELGFRCSVGEGKEKKILIVNRIPVANGDGVIGVISQSLFGDIGELKDLSDRLSLLESKVSRYREKIKSVLSAKYCLEDIKGQSPAILYAKELIQNYARTDSPVLLLGATGTGKELFSHSLHQESERFRAPFVSINCAAIPKELFESELFGYEPGAFTGAQKDGKMGQIELADRGTLFLDEIGDMPLHAQVKLLRVLEDKIVYRLGSHLPKQVDFRLIAATNRDLKTMIREGKFREELYYRLSTMSVSIPLLRERIDDLSFLIRHFLGKLNRQEIKFSQPALEALKKYEWPGNVRELKNAIERAVSLCKGDVVDCDQLPDEVTAGTDCEVSNSLRAGRSVLSTLACSERKLILAMLDKNDWNMAKTAKQLGISRATLYEKAKKYSFSRSSRDRDGNA
jgi:transcriptional regulator with PAS, ATPase and Fis domain